MRIYYINLNANEFYYLRFLFLNISNFLFYKNLRILNDDFFLNYYVIYIIKNLIYNNVKWNKILKKINVWKNEDFLRSLFIMFLFNYEFNKSFNL